MRQIDVNSVAPKDLADFQAREFVDETAAEGEPCRVHAVCAPKLSPVWVAEESMIREFLRGRAQQDFENSTSADPVSLWLDREEDAGYQGVCIFRLYPTIRPTIPFAVLFMGDRVLRRWQGDLGADHIRAADVMGMKVPWLGVRCESSLIPILTR